MIASHGVASSQASRSDAALLAAVLAANPGLLHTVKFIPNVKSGGHCYGPYICDPMTNIWKRRHNLVVEEVLAKAFERVTDLTSTERHHVHGRRGRADMVRALAGEALDAGFVEKLDANLDLLAASNGVFDTSPEALREGGGRPLFRPIAREDLVSNTTGWAYDAEASRTHRVDVEDFLAKILPVPEERRVVLAFVATLFSGRRELKKFLVLTARRGGNNGKTCLLLLILTFLGDYGKTTTKFVCRGALDRARVSHDTGLEAAKGMRLVATEELAKSTTLDEGFLKSKSGGAGVVAEGRRFGKNAPFRFVWQAAFLLVFDEGGCPQFDHQDAEFVGRMLVAPMRSKFVEEPPRASNGGEAAEREWTFPVDRTVHAKFPVWMSAFADVLREHYGIQAFAQLPAEMRM